MSISVCSKCGKRNRVDVTRWRSGTTPVCRMCGTTLSLPNSVAIDSTASAFEAKPLKSEMLNSAPNWSKIFKKIKAAILGKNYLDARLIADRNPKKAASILLTLAEADDTRAMMDLAAAYHYGNVCGSMGKIPVDLVKAVYWYEKLRQKNVIQAFEDLWILYLQSKDEARGEKALIDAANAGCPNSMRFLGLCYLDGSLTFTENDPKGLFWIRKAAKTGDLYSQIELAKIYLDGKYVEQDLNKAYMWYVIASAKEKIEAHKRYRESLERFKGQYGRFNDIWKPKEPSSGDAENAKNGLSLILSKEQILKAQQMAETCLAVEYNGFD